MEKRHKMELRAGLFVNLGLALAMLALFFFGNSTEFLTKSAPYSFNLPDAQGLIVGTKVLVAGLSAGKVTQLSLDPRNRNVRVELALDHQYEKFIREDSFADVSTQGVLGDKVVLIEPGTAELPPIEPGGAIPAHLSTNWNQIVGTGNELLKHLDHLAVNLDGLIAGFSSGKHPKEISQEILDNLQKLDSILGKLDQGNGTLGALLNDPELYSDMKALVGEADNNRILRNIVRKTIEDSERNRSSPTS